MSEMFHRCKACLSSLITAYHLTHQTCSSQIVYASVQQPFQPQSYRSNFYLTAWCNLDSASSGTMIDHNLRKAIPV